MAVSGGRAAGQPGLAAAFSRGKRDGVSLYRGQGCGSALSIAKATALHGMDARSPSQHRRHDVTLHPFAGSIDRAHTVDPLDSALLVLQSYTSLHH